MMYKHLTGDKTGESSGDVGLTICGDRKQRNRVDTQHCRTQKTQTGRLGGGCKRGGKNRTNQVKVGVGEKGGLFGVIARKPKNMRTKRKPSLAKRMQSGRKKGGGGT